MKWIATYGWTNRSTGRAEYRAHHFDAQDINHAYQVANHNLKDGEYLFEIRARKVQD